MSFNWSEQYFESYLQSIPEDRLALLIGDCEKCFSCTSVEAKSNYSEGQTYFQPCDAEPTNILEAFALSAFQHHSRNISGINRRKSGAEWWTQVINSDDDIGFHWDRDYGEEEKHGKHIYPAFGTVTYLSISGGPTVMMNIEGTANSTITPNNNGTSMVLSKPIIGKHIKFKGNLLHAAPSDILLNCNEDDNISIDSESETETSSSSVDHSTKSDTSTLSTKRITFLVNVWFNHKPSQSVRFPVKLNKKWKLSLPDDKSKFIFDYKSPLSSYINIKNINEINDNENMLVNRRWKFIEGDTTLVVTVPIYTNIQGYLKKYTNSLVNTQNSSKSKGKRKETSKCENKDASNIVISYGNVSNDLIKLQSLESYLQIRQKFRNVSSNKRIKCMQSS